MVFFFPLAPLHSPLTCAYRVNAASAVNWLVSFRRRWRKKEGDEQEETRSNAKRSKRACDYVSDRGVTGSPHRHTSVSSDCFSHGNPPGRVVFFFPLAPLHSPLTCAYRVNAASAVNWLVSFRRRWRMKEGDEQEETRSNAKRTKRACDYVSDRGVTGYIAKSTNKTLRNYTKESCLRRQRKIQPYRVVFFFPLAPLHTPRTCGHQITAARLLRRRKLRIACGCGGPRRLLTPLLLLSVKSHAAIRLFACKRAHDGSLLLPTFYG